MIPKTGPILVLATSPVSCLPPPASTFRPPHSIIAKPAPACPRRAIDHHPDLPPCAGCGRCCHLVVELRPGDRVPEALVTEHAGVRCMDQRGNGACVALDPVTMLCTIYDTRPQTCRDFHRGENLCRHILAPYLGRSSPPR